MQKDKTTFPDRRYKGTCLSELNDPERSTLVSNNETLQYADVTTHILWPPLFLVFDPWTTALVGHA